MKNYKNVPNAHVPNTSGFEIDEDDLPIGRVLNRRDALALLGSVVFLGACAPIQSDGTTVGGEAAADVAAVEEASANVSTSCVVRPELTEGPLFVEEDLNRSDIRSDPSNGQVSEGTQLDLTFRVSTVADGACMPLAGAQVDVWHCDAYGVYSDTSQLGMQTVGQKFLRGFQVTDENGIARFTTIYPGWYSGRAVHIHFKIRTEDGYDFTSQLFFDEGLNDAVFANAPYNSRGEQTVRNENDGIYLGSDGQLTLDVSEVESGYAADFDVALDMT